MTLAAILAIGTILPHALVPRRHPRDLGLGPDGAPLEAAPAADTPDARAAPADRSGTRGTFPVAELASRGERS